MLNFILFSITYIFIFSGYYLTTSFLNILYPNYAFISFAIFYGVYGIGSLFAGYAIEKIGFKILLFLSCITFCIFVGFSGSNIVSLLLIGSVFAGLGNSVIWLIQGVFLESREMANFYTLFNVNIILGNLLGLIILLVGLSAQVMILSMLALTGIGSILALFVKQKSEKKTERINLKNVFLSFNLMVPSYIYQAIGLNITYQIIPRLLKDPIFNTITFIVYGCFAMGFSWLWGKLFVRNWKYVVIPYSILEIMCLIGILLLGKTGARYEYWIIIGATRGVIDYGINNMINITLANSLDTSSSFSLYRFIYAIAYLLCSICIGYIPYEYILLLDFLSLFFSSFTYFLFIRREEMDVMYEISKSFESSAIQI